MFYEKTAKRTLLRVCEVFSGPEKRQGVVL